MLYSIKQYPLFFFALLLPPASIVGALIVYPVLNGVYMSFTNASPLRPSVTFVGWDNYRYLFSDEVFFASMFNTTYIVVIASAMAVTVGFLMALLLHFGTKRFAAFYRAMVFQIWVTPWICIAILWSWIFAKDYGLVNFILVTLGFVENNMDILFTKTGAQWAIISAYTWRAIPFLMVISLAGMQSISIEVLEASELDGASFFSRVKHIILPALRNVIIVALLLDTVRFFQEMTMPLLVTAGGPINATMVLSLFTYKLAFENWDFALASTAGTVWLVAVILFTWFLLRLTKNKEQEV
jgi:multiple sugar transport system permease protein